MQYLKEIYEELEYYATWKPELELKLGDIGYIENNYFDYYSNLKRRSINFRKRLDRTPGDFKYETKKLLAIKFKAAGKAAPMGSTLTKLDAGLIIKFKKAAGIYFETFNAYINLIEDQIALEEEVLERFYQNKWDPRLVIITEIVNAERAVIFISKSKKSKIELKANGAFKMGTLNIADAEADFQVISAKFMDTRTFATKGITPLFRVKGLVDECGCHIKFKPPKRQRRKLIDGGKIRFDFIKHADK